MRERNKKRLKKARDISIGLPSLNENVLVGLFCFLGARLRF